MFDFKDETSQFRFIPKTTELYGMVLCAFKTITQIVNMIRKKTDDVIFSHPTRCPIAQDTLRILRVKQVFAGIALYTD